MDSEDDSFADQSTKHYAGARFRKGSGIVRAQNNKFKALTSVTKSTSTPAHDKASTESEGKAPATTLPAPLTVENDENAQELDSDDSDFDAATGGVGFTAMESPTESKSDLAKGFPRNPAITIEGT